MPILADNKQARFDYEILETVEAGLVLTGQETKSVRQGGLNLRSAFVTLHQGGACLTNAHIAPYRFAGPLLSYQPTRSRALLLHRRELNALQGRAHTKGLTLIPLKVYTNNHFIKVTVALARGRKKYDKREVIKKRETAREARKYKN